MTEQSGFQLIPGGAKVGAGVAFSAAVILGALLFDSHFSIVVGALSGAGVGALIGAYILLAGYVYGDAARRGMPPALWTALAVLVPNMIGFVLYFLLRKPLVHPCLSCRFGVAAGAAFCPACGQPQFSREVRQV